MYIVCVQIDPGGHTEGEVRAPTSMTIRTGESASNSFDDMETEVC